MASRNYTLTPPSNPILQVLYFVAGGVVLIGAVLMGAVILAFALGLALIAGIIFYIRVLWLKRKLARQRPAPGGKRPGAADSEVLEVEYTVISEEDDRER
jgi:hypothetical protein